MNSRAQHFIEAIKTASSSTEVVRLWTEAAKGKDLTMKDIINIHQACGRILLEAVYESHSEDSEVNTPSPEFKTQAKK